MADSLGGILTGGLLGSGVNSLILAKFNLFGFGVEVVEPPIEPPIIGGGGGGGFHQVQDSRKILRFWVNFRGKQYSKSYMVSEKTAIPIVKIVNKVEPITTKIAVTIKNIGKKND